LIARNGDRVVSKLARLVCLLGLIFYLKGDRMKIFKYIRSRIVVSVIAANFVASPLSIAGNTSQLAGKNLGQNRELVNSVMQGRNYVVEVGRQGEIKKVVDAGAKGSGKDAQQSVASPMATGGVVSPVVSSIEIPANYQGQNAIDFIGGDLPNIAGQAGLTPDKLKDMLLTDNTIRVDKNKRIFYIDDSVEQTIAGNNSVAAGAIANAATANSPELPISLTPTMANAFSLHSKPGASKTIYLDFDGYTASNTAWSSSTIEAPAYDLDGNPSVFNDSELANIISIWGRVAEDFIPFDVDVTTESPSMDALIRASTADNVYGTRVVITKTGTVRCNCGGIAYVGMVSTVNNTVFQPAWVFQQSLANNEKFIAEAISHEAGHTLGLFHDGQIVGTTVSGYYAGHGSGVTSWAPIMGVGYYKNVTQWSRGDYPSANNLQDDFAVLASNGFMQRTDDVGNTFISASPLNNTASVTAATVQKAGVIENSNDVDMYRVDTAGGLIKLMVKPVAKGANLDTKLTLYGANGATVAVSAPEKDLSASISATLPAGVYFAEVKGAAHAAVDTDYGYPTYGSLGQYQLSGTYISSGIAVAPTAVLTASTLSGPASLDVNFSALNSVGNGSITGYQWSFGDGAYSSSEAPMHTYTKEGTFTVTLSVTNQYLLTNTASVQITVTPPPTATISAASLRIAVIKNKNLVSKVAVTVVDNKKRLIPNAVVTGAWSGSFSGTVSGKTGANGTAVQTASPIKAKTGGTATYTLNGIVAPGYVYKPNLNVKRVVTVAW
jgi:PKD repeat protein